MTENNFENKKWINKKDLGKEYGLEYSSIVKDIQETNDNSNDIQNKSFDISEIPKNINTELEVGIESDPRFKEIIEQALEGVDLSEVSLMENEEIKKAKDNLQLNSTISPWKASLLALVAVIYSGCASNGIYRAETAEGGMKQSAMYAIANILVKKAQEKGYADGPLARETMDSISNTIGEQTRDWDTKPKMEEADNAYNYGLRYPNASCEIYRSGRGNRENGEHEYNSCMRGKNDREKGKVSNSVYEKDKGYKIDKTTDATKDVKAGQRLHEESQSNTNYGSSVSLGKKLN